ncbi:MAG: hypothetical protein ACK5RG_12490 [Cyclobacteriaceae bacterium]|jgi:hypothetical protein|nr:hypothetical protein [Flammeovirgaceae bacterium]
MISNEIRSTLETVCRALNKHNVDYMLVGGTAVAFYGYQRISGVFVSNNPEVKIDHDFWYNPTNENFINLLKSLSDLGVATHDLEHLVFDPQRTFLKIPFSTYHTDFLPQMKGLSSYRECKRRCQRILLDENELFVISKEDLLNNKAAVNRSIDQRDLDALR